MKDFRLELPGFCPICECPTLFTADGVWLRDTLTCATCAGGSIPRERALALVLNRERPEWRSLRIHESSPGGRGISLKMSQEAKFYTGTQYFPEAKVGTVVDGWRNENFEATTFADESFEIVISMDVTEHVFHPRLLFEDVYRTLKPGGLYLSTFPIQKNQVEGLIQRARISPSGKVEFLQDAQYHFNPLNNHGSLVTWDYGYDVHLEISKWVPFAVEIVRLVDPSKGVLGEFTEVVICRKPLN